MKTSARSKMTLCIQTGAHYLLNFRLQNYFLELPYYASVIFEMMPAIMWRKFNDARN